MIYNILPRNKFKTDHSDYVLYFTAIVHLCTKQVHLFGMSIILTKNVANKLLPRAKTTEFSTDDMQFGIKLRF